ncbi:pyridoxal phosphate-dependent aminotransferase [Arthrospiribacter ruber]|uniref:Histidinol-phosphate aminotransferase family protein n=1 Tax=Arthrospiribacter ruber TaxID=2487934 RepID=A0A951MCM3_9BACT|nr:histidinol-phosphate transaminase [Arthrospiribacter ruber]MBW3469496.1 histidinol-phosphate aminotransferase family protein [Arthrospiribacter ruber]
MSITMNRRHWIKSGLMTLGAIAVGPSISFSKEESSKARSVIKEVLPDFSFNESRILARLSANENPYGPSPKVLEAVTSSLSSGNRYGHADAATLIKMIAEKEGVTPDHIMLGPGSSDLLEKTAFVRFMDGKGNIVSADPAYMSIIHTAESLGANWKPVKLKGDYSHDLSAMEQAVDADTRLVYVCNPNNPTGSITDPVALRAFCSKVSAKSPVFVDEAYLEFLDNPESHTMVGLVSESKDVIVARTFSKIHGMAGMRIGYIVAQPERIQSITNKVRSTMGLCVTSLKGAIASLQDTSFLESCKEKNAACRDFASSELFAMGYEVIPSYTSFMLFPISMEGKSFMKNMYDEGVGIRVFTIEDQPYCRVSVGTMEEMELFVSTIKNLKA